MSIHDNLFDLLEEMAEPTGPILSWKAQVHIKQFLSHEEELPSRQYAEKGKGIARKLKRCALFMDYPGTEQIVYDLEHVTSEKALNEQLADVYDICDSLRVWCR